ncbi:MAG: site-specific DNA-methyltransferase [Campylobacter sp.]|nr:site-specific DNA-methyltransferase [Campylobacter sp.]
MIKSSAFRQRERESNSGLEFSKESFGLNFLGKSYARFLANQNPNSWLKADETHNKQNQNSQNLLIKGDNLEVLRHLQNAYNGEIKMIYIDPPYNTGGDGFVYNDDRKYSPEQIAKIANLDKDESKRLFKFLSKEQSSHSAWCVFMYPRLKLARNLLKDDGVIFISIDDNEQAVLKLLCDEVFGEENFIANVIWQKSYSPINLKKHFSNSHDYILCYSKKLEKTICNGLPRNDEANARYSNPDNDPRGLYKQATLSVGPAVQENIYEIISPSGKKFLPPSNYSWMFSRERYQEMLDDNRIYFGNNGNNAPTLKRFLSEVKNSITPITSWHYSEVSHQQDAMRDLKELFNNNVVFDYPKPIKLIQRMLQLYTNPNNNDIILDFFAGSGTTAHAIMDLNAKDGENRKFILVQLDEKIDEKKNKTAYDFCKNELKSENPSIFDITKERIIRAGKKIKSESANLLNSELDLGFKIYEICENKRALPNDKLDDEISLFENLNELKDKDDLNAVLNAFRLYDGVELTQKCEILDLNGYEAYKFESKIYLINPNFGSENLKILLEKIDNDITPEKIVVYGVNFPSVIQREISENIKEFNSKKELKISVLIRY